MTNNLKDQIKVYIEKVGKEITFNEIDHIYFRNSDSYSLTGVTTILNVRQKPFLQFWSIKEGVKYLGWFDKKEKDETLLNNLVKRHSEITSMDVDSYWRELDNAKKAHTVKSNKGKEKGKEAHDWISNYIKGIQQPIPSDEEVLSCVQAFLNWEANNKIEWLASEVMVWSPKHLFAGTLDFLCMYNGKFTLGDIKTSSMISEENFLQTAGYNLCLEEAGIIPEQRLILRCSKDGKDFQDLIIKTDLKFDQEVFLSLRQVHRWNIYIQNNFLDKNKFL